MTDALTLHVFDRITSAPMVDHAWELYRRLFAPLAPYAVQQHLMPRPDFEAIMADKRIDKHCAVAGGWQRGGRLLGMGVLTNEIEAWPLISPAYFERRWPRLAAERKIWWCGFVGVDPHAPAGTFRRLIDTMYAPADLAGGIVGIDVCAYNDEVHHLTRAVTRMLMGTSAGRVVVEVADAQRYVLFHTTEGTS